MVKESLLTMLSWQDKQPYGKSDPNLQQLAVAHEIATKFIGNKVQNTTSILLLKNIKM